MTTLRQLILTALQPPGGGPTGTDQLAADLAIQKRSGCDGLPDDVSGAAVARECKVMAREGLIAYRGAEWAYVPQHAAVKVVEQKELF